MSGGTDPGRPDLLARADLLARFVGAPARIGDLARAWVASGRHVPAGEWGPSEIVRHLVAVEREVWWIRLPALRDEDEPRWSWAEPGLEPALEGATLDAILGRFAEARARSVAILDDFDEATWAKTGVHATYGRLDAAGLLRIATDHDDEHARSLAAG